MKLDISEILHHVGMRFPYEIDEPPYVDEDLECATGISGKIVISNTGSVLLIDGNASTTVTLACSRCLEYYQEPINIVVQEQFLIESMGGPRGRPTMVVIEEDESPAAEKLFEGSLFDLTELLRQGITLGLPTQPLHNLECKGLCQVCGANLNTVACECSAKQVNPAMAKLAELLEDKLKN